MNDCDFRFAICDWVARSICSRRFANSSIESRVLSLTPRFSGVGESAGSENRFSGFERRLQTAEAVQRVDRRIGTPLKRGVNETSTVGMGCFVARACITDTIGLGFRLQIANRKSKI